MKIKYLIWILVLTMSASSMAADYYFSSSKGKNRYDGSIEKPWETLEHLKEIELQPGDTVHLKSSDNFQGPLVVRSSGRAGSPIHYTSYGKGELPVVDGASARGGSALAAIIIENNDHIELSNLKVTNFRKKRRPNIADVNAYGILVKNTGKRNLRGFNFHHLEVDEVYPIRAKQSFNNTSVTGIRFETIPAKSKSKAYNTGDIHIHNNLIKHTARFGIALRHRPSRIEGVTGTAKDYDTEVRITNNRCEDTAGSCVLMNGVWNGLLENNDFIRSGALVELDVSVNRGSGAWFFRSNHVVAQHNRSIGSRGHNDSAGMHVDFNNENILVQYNYFYDNEGYGTEVLGKNKNIIWRYNVSVADAFRKVGVKRPEGGKSQHPGKTIFVSDFAVPKRTLSEQVYIYNNTYLVASDSDPMIEINANDVHLWNNLFAVEQGGRLGRKVTLGSKDGKIVDIRGNVYTGNIAPNFVRLDPAALVKELIVSGDVEDPKSFALKSSQLKGHKYGIAIEHPRFPAAGSGIFSHISEFPTQDYFGNTLNTNEIVIGAGFE